MRFAKRYRYQGGRRGCRKGIGRCCCGCGSAVMSAYILPLPPHPLPTFYLHLCLPRYLHELQRQTRHARHTGSTGSDPDHRWSRRREVTNHADAAVGEGGERGRLQNERGERGRFQNERGNWRTERGGRRPRGTEPSKYQDRNMDPRKNTVQCNTTNKFQNKIKLQVLGTGTSTFTKYNFV